MTTQRELATMVSRWARNSGYRFEMDYDVRTRETLLAISRFGESSVCRVREEHIERLDTSVEAAAGWFIDTLTTLTEGLSMTALSGVSPMEAVLGASRDAICDGVVFFLRRYGITCTYGAVALRSGQDVSFRVRGIRDGSLVVEYVVAFSDGARRCGFDIAQDIVRTLRTLVVRDGETSARVVGHTGPVRLRTGSDGPNTPVVGQLVMDRDTGVARMWNGSTWVTVDANVNVGGGGGGTVGFGIGGGGGASGAGLSRVSPMELRYNEAKSQLAKADKKIAELEAALKAISPDNGPRRRSLRGRRA